MHICMIMYVWLIVCYLFWLSGTLLLVCVYLEHRVCNFPQAMTLCRLYMYDVYGVYVMYIYHVCHVYCIHVMYTYVLCVHMYIHSSHVQTFMYTFIQHQQTWDPSGTLIVWSNAQPNTFVLALFHIPKYTPHPLTSKHPTKIRVL